MGKLVIGLQMYTLRDFCKNAADIAQTLPKIKKIGYNVIQASGMAPLPAKELKKLLDDAGIYACSTHTGYPPIVNETDRVIEDHKILGCEAIECPGLPMELHNKAGYLKVAADFAKVLPKIKAAGLTLGYHNHSLELEQYDGKTGLAYLLDSCPGLESEIDTYWIQHGGGDPADWIEKYSGRLSQIHFKDMGNKRGEHTMPPIGDGNLNWPRILQACARAGTRFALVEMDTPTLEPFEAVQRSLNNMLKWGLSATR